MLYRAIKEGAFSMLARIDANQFFYEDDEVQLNNSYRYKIKAVFLDGKNSQLSNPFTVLY
jgi:fibronectin type 3 domain-containing protein